MAAINKNFVIKNGLEVDTNLIFADAYTNKVGIGTTVPQYTLHVNGGIGATDLYVSGIGTIVTLQSTAGIITNLTATNLFAGVGTITRIQSTNINNSGVTTSTTLNITGIATIAVGVVTFLSGTNLNYSGIGTIVSLNSTNANVSGITTLGITSATDLTSQQLNVSGISTLGVTSTTNLTSQQLNVSGITTLAITSATNLTSQQLNVSGISTLGVTSTTNLTSQQLNVSGITTLGITSATNLTSQQLNVSGISTVGVLTATRIGIGTTNPTSELVIVGNVFVSGISTLGTVKISSGIVTATSGVVTYFGDGNFLNLTSNPSRGIGIGITGGVVGYAVTFINFKGAGVSTTQYNSNTGIATIFFEGGGGGGSISISTTAPLLPGSGDLWYSPDYGRTFIYYDESVVGYGTDAFWVDAAPFNVGIITSLTNVSFSPGSAVSPSMFFVGDNQTGFFSPGSGQFTVVSSGSSVLNVNASGINITGIATITNASGTVKIGIGTTALLVEGNARVTGILTVGSSSITLNGTTNIINVGTGLTLSSSGVNVTGIITASSFIGGISSVTQLNVSGISTLGNIEISSGIVTTTASYFELYKPVLSNYSEKVNVIGNTGASCNINLANGAYVTATLNQTTTFTFTTGVTVGALGFALQLTNGSGGPYTITWPASVKWPNNAIPTRTTTDSKTDVWVFNSTDNGTNWYGNLALYNFS